MLNRGYKRSKKACASLLLNYYKIDSIQHLRNPLKILLKQVDVGIVGDLNR